MADEDHSLPLNQEEHFQQQQQQVDLQQEGEAVPGGNMEEQQQQQEQQQDPQPQYELPEQNQQAEEAQQNFILGAGDDQMNNHHHELDLDQHYPYPEVDEPPRPSGDVFQPTVYIAPESYVMPRRRDQGANGEGADVANPAQYDADEHTVWIDSDGDEDPEDLILKQNFYLPYSDHNYDCFDPSMRVIHPQEGVFPIIDDLDEEGNVTRQYMPKGYEYLARKVEEDDELPPREDDIPPAPRQPVLQQPHQPEQYQSPPHAAAPIPMPRGRPVNTAAPFSIGGNQVDYGEPRGVPQRGVIPPRDQNFRVYNDYGASVLTPVQQLPRGVSVNNRVPAAAIIRGQAGPQAIYQQSPQRGPRVTTTVHPSPGSYSHIMNPTPGGGPSSAGPSGLRRGPPSQQAAQPRGVSVGPGILTRPIGRPQPQQRIVDMQEREFVEHPLPLPPQSLAPRRVTDMAPHRMTQEQRLEQQQRQRAQFSAPPRTPVVAGSPARPTGAVGPGRRVPGSSPAHQAPEELLRSPQRVVAAAQPPIHEPKRFQVKPTDTYSTPIPKASNQLPAQLTEDPDEPSTSAPAQKEPEASAPQPMDDIEPPSVVAPVAPGAPVSAPEDVRMSPIKSPARLPSANTSPMKGPGPQHHHTHLKPTPPHRMTQEEKSAHLARLATDKEKPLEKPASSIPSSSSQPPPPLRHEDPLAVVQSVFDSSKPRQPDTPKDKEEISKIANELRFSADKFTVQSGPGSSQQQQQRPRTISGGQGQAQRAPAYHPMHPHHQQPHHPQQMHHNAMDMMNQEARKRHGSGRFDSMSMQQLPPHLRNVAPLQEPPTRHPEAGLEPPHRPRGRPRGSTGHQRGRYPSGGNDQPPVPPPAAVAPQRAAGGARTLPPRVAQPTNGNRAPPQNNSDSESEGIEGEESWEMRCHCGMDHGDGDTVECETCKTWQHMACMGLNPKSDTSNYKCERCQPRKLPVTKAEAIKAQKKILEKLIRATEKDKKSKRKSEPIEQAKKQVQQPSTSRKSAPMSLQQAPMPIVVPLHRGQQLNEYSKAASALLANMPQTAGADTLLEDSRRHKKARRMFVEENVEALVTVEVVAIRAVILEVNGYVSMANEVKRQPGGGNCVFMYDGLMKGTSGEDMGDGQELVCIDAKKKGNDTKYTRRSCIPNCVLKHVLGSQATLGIMVVATKDIHRNTEVTLPFDADWRDSDIQLECAEHCKEMHLCPFESERRRFAQERLRIKEQEKRKAEHDRRAVEEQRRLEEEVRRERAAKMNEEAEKEKMEELKAKKAEREEARRKKEEEKKKEAEKKEKEEKEKAEKEKAERAEKKKAEKAEAEKKEAERKAEEKKKEETSSRTTETTLSGREQRRINNAEEIFRRQEEEEKRKAAKAERAKSQTPDTGPSTSGTSSSTRKSSRQQKRRDSQESESDVGTPSRSVFTTAANATAAVAASGASRSSKRMQSVASSSQTPAVKRPRATTVVTPRTDASNNDNASRKRRAAEAPAGVGTSSALPKTPKKGPPKIKPKTTGELKLLVNTYIEKLHKDDDSTKIVDFSTIIPDYLKDESKSEWVNRMKNPNKENHEKEELKKIQEKNEASLKKSKAERNEKKQRAELSQRYENLKKEKKEKERQKREREMTPEVEKRASTSSTPGQAPPVEPKGPEEPVKAPAPKVPKEAAPAPVPPAKEASKEPSPPTKEAAKEGSKEPGPAPPPAKKPADDFHGMEREASLSTEGSVEKELPTSSQPEGATVKKKQKKLSMEEYRRKKDAEMKESSSSTTPSSTTTDAAAGAAGTSSTATSAPPTRKGFIPSTEGSELVNVQLSAIPLDKYLGTNVSTTTTTTAPSAPIPSSGASSVVPASVATPPPPPPTTTTNTTSIASASRLTRGGAARAVESAESEAEHSQSLADRIHSVFGIQVQQPPRNDVPPPPPPSHPPPPPPPTSSSRPRRQTRWHE